MYGYKSKPNLTENNIFASGISLNKDFVIAKSCRPFHIDSSEVKCDKVRTLRRAKRIKEGEGRVS